MTYENNCETEKNLQVWYDETDSEKANEPYKKAALIGYSLYQLKNEFSHF